MANPSGPGPTSLKAKQSQEDVVVSGGVQLTDPNRANQITQGLGHKFATKPTTGYTVTPGRTAPNAPVSKLFITPQ